MPLDQITWLLAILILPWTFKFLWAPLLDLLRGRQWGYRNWILVTQAGMVLALAPLLSLDLGNQFTLISVFLMGHAIAAATQDVAIDALCIASTAESERASLNGWMQAGMLTGRALMGGGSLVLEQWIGFQNVVLVLMAVIAFSSILVWLSVEKPVTQNDSTAERFGLAKQLWRSLRSPIVWIGVAFALIGPAAFKSLEAIIGPMLIDHDYSEVEIGSFTATFMIGFMIVGSLLAGRLASLFRPKPFVAITLSLNLSAIGILAVADAISGSQRGTYLLVMLTVVALTIGMLTVAMYAWLMNSTERSLAATQFTLFMACTNACEAWSTPALGQLQIRLGYPIAIGILCGVSATGLLILAIGGAGDQAIGDQRRTS